MSDEMAHIYVNGKPTKVQLPCAISGLLDQYGWRPTQVVVEHNGQVVRRSDLGQVSLADGDRLEVILPVAGG